jgi:deoxyribonuclease-4
MVNNLPNLNYGSHMSMANVHKALDLNIKCVQVFFASPSTFLLASPTIKSRNKIKSLISNGIAVYVHGRYIINLSRDESFAKYTNGMAVAIDDINISGGLGCSGVVYHIGKHVEMNSTHAVNTMIKNIKLIIDNTSENNGKFILETPAGAGTELCFNLEDLADMYNQLPNNYKHKMKFCIDTAHIWASGYNITSFKGMIEYINQFNRLIGWRNVELIHLNDSKAVCGSRKDLHEDITKGNIWCDDSDGLELLLLVCQITGKHVIFETPSCRTGKYDEFTIINSLINNNKFHKKKVFNFIQSLM